MTGTDTERAIRAATCDWCKEGIQLSPNGKEHVNGGLCMSADCIKELLPLFQAATEQAVSGILQRVVLEIACHAHASGCASLKDQSHIDADLCDCWNRSLCNDILSLTPADARQAQEPSPCGKAGHTMAHWIKPEYDEDGSPVTWASCEMCAAIEARGRLEEAKGLDLLMEKTERANGSWLNKRKLVKQRITELEAAARSLTPDATNGALCTKCGKVFSECACESFIYLDEQGRRCTKYREPATDKEQG